MCGEMVMVCSCVFFLSFLFPFLSSVHCGALYKLMYDRIMFIT